MQIDHAARASEVVLQGWVERRVKALGFVPSWRKRAATLYRSGVFTISETPGGRVEDSYDLNHCACTAKTAQELVLSRESRQMLHLRVSDKMARNGEPSSAHWFGALQWGNHEARRSTQPLEDPADQEDQPTRRRSAAEMIAADIEHRRQSQELGSTQMTAWSSAPLGVVSK